MNIQPSKLKDAPEEWIVKYRAAIDADLRPRTRTPRFLAALDRAGRNIVSKIARFVNDWIPAHTIPAKAPVESATVTDSVLPTPFQNRRRTLHAQIRVPKKAG
jgi:hypothetical protein